MLGLSSFWTIVVILIIILVIWLILRSQSSRDDLGAIESHDDHDHSGHDHAEETAGAGASATEEKVPEKPDELKKIEGIGPKVAELLNSNGINSFADLAAAGADKLNKILDEAEYQYMDAGSWPEQAALAVAGDWDALDKLQDELKGGQ